MPLVWPSPESNPPLVEESSAVSASSSAGVRLRSAKSSIVGVALGGGEEVARRVEGEGEDPAGGGAPLSRRRNWRSSRNSTLQSGRRQ